MSHQAERDRVIGGKLPKVEALALTAPGSPQYDHYQLPGFDVALGTHGNHVLRAALEFAPDETPWEVRPLLGHLPTVQQALDVLGYGNDMGSFQAWLENNHLSEEEAYSTSERPLTFGEMAALSEGIPALGALMLDADSMGEVFQRGFEHLGGVGPDRVASLSRMVELFFSSEVATLIKEPQRYAERLGFGDRASWKLKNYPLIYSVYSGGDDLFLIGPWNVLLEFALDLEALYRQFTGLHPDLTLSGGFVLVKPSHPLTLIAEAAQRAERVAKEAGRNRLSLFGQPVTWSELARVRDVASDLKDKFAHGLPRSFAYRLLELYKVWQRWDEDEDPEGMRYKPQLYYLHRHPIISEARDFLAPLFDHTSTEIRTLPVWVHWAVYETRGA